jgi:hypothetical protein
MGMWGRSTYKKIARLKRLTMDVAPHNTQPRS